MDAAEEDGRPEERDCVERERIRPLQELDEHAADRVAGQERERAAAVDQRVRGDVVLARDEHLEERAVRHVEEDAERPGGERDDVEVAPAEVAERVGDRHGQDHEPARDVGREHHDAPVPEPVHPGPRVEGEEQVRDERDRGEEAHLARCRAEREHGGERQREQADLVADQRHGLPDEVAAEVPVALQEGRQHRPRTLVDRRGLAVQHRAHLAGELVGAERLLEERDPGLEHAVAVDRGVGVAGDVEHLGAGARVRRRAPPRRGRSSRA